MEEVMKKLYLFLSLMLCTAGTQAFAAGEIIDNNIEASATTESSDVAYRGWGGRGFYGRGYGYGAGYGTSIPAYSYGSEGGYSDVAGDASGACCERPCGDCYCLYCKYIPEYYNVQKCCYVPQYCYKKCCRYCPQYYQQQCCRYVPQYYCKTCCRYCPQYYYTCDCNYCPQYYCEKRCRYKPCYYYKHTCAPTGCDNACANGQCGVR